ncbi:MAG: hypothetical protein K8U57_16030, partial [Planctomycetes bacterium]|nr:hypothetical protein [Planctomycetota bacterium]
MFTFFLKETEGEQDTEGAVEELTRISADQGLLLRCPDKLPVANYRDILWYSEVTPSVVGSKSCTEFGMPAMLKRSSVLAYEVPVYAWTQTRGVDSLHHRHP